MMMWKKAVGNEKKCDLLVVRVMFTVRNGTKRERMLLLKQNETNAVWLKVG